MMAAGVESTTWGNLLLSASPLNYSWSKTNEQFLGVLYLALFCCFACPCVSDGAIEDTLALLKQRVLQYKVAAQQANKQGDKPAAIKYVKVIKVRPLIFERTL